MFYSKSTGGFYDAEIHGDAIPSDAVEITAEQHAALMDGQKVGKYIVSDGNGQPMLADPPAPTEQQVKEARVAAIDAELAEIDRKGARPSRDIAAALAAGESAPAAAVQKLVDLEAQASILRAERRTLMA